MQNKEVRLVAINYQYELIYPGLDAIYLNGEADEKYISLEEFDEIQEQDIDNLIEALKIAKQFLQNGDTDPLEGIRASME